MLIWLSLGLMVAFFIVAAVDGVYFHLWKFRLFARPESRVEHALHTARALLAAPIVGLLYITPPGPLLVVSVLVGLDQLAAVVDVLIEPKSRKLLGGLPRSEFQAHVLATIFHVGAIALAIIARFQLAEHGTPAFSNHVKIVAIALATGAIAVAALHMALLHPVGARRFATRPQTIQWP